MKKLQQLALIMALLGFGLAWLVYEQVDMQSASYSAGGIGVIVMVISLPLLVASAAFNIPSTLILLHPKKRQKHGFDDCPSYLLWGINWLLLTVYCYFALLIFRIIFRS